MRQRSRSMSGTDASLTRAANIYSFVTNTWSRRQSKMKMRVAKDRVVAVRYILKDDQGNLLDSNTDGEPLSYIHGTGMLLAGVESALVGKTAGEETEVSLTAEDGYGVRDESLVTTVPREKLAALDKEELGTRFHMETEDGQKVYTLVRRDEKEVVLDGNHPLAGVDLQFNLTVLEVRDATAEERDHGHVHDSAEPH